MKGKGTKLTKDFLKALKEVLKDDSVAFLTDEQVITLVNDKLPKEKKITKRVWENWKSGDTPKQFPNEAKQFNGLIKMALIQQKIYLFKRMLDAKSGEWQKYAWMIERKFPEWRLNHQVDITSQNERITGINYIIPSPNNVEK